MPKRKILQPMYCQNTASAATAHGAFPKRFIVPNLYAIFTTKKSVSLVKFEHMKKLVEANVMFTMAIISNYIVSVYTIFNLETMHNELMASGIWKIEKVNLFT